MCSRAMPLFFQLLIIMHVVHAYAGITGIRSGDAMHVILVHVCGGGDAAATGGGRAQHPAHVRDAEPAGGDSGGAVCADARAAGEPTRRQALSGALVIPFQPLITSSSPSSDRVTRWKGLIAGCGCLHGSWKLLLQ
jgi:hypothetical protein